LLEVRHAFTSLAFALTPRLLGNRKMNKITKIFLPINFGVIVLALFIYNFTELPYAYVFYPIPLAFLISLILVVPKSQVIIRLFIWAWLFTYFAFPMVVIALGLLGVGQD